MADENNVLATLTAEGKTLFKNDERHEAAIEKIYNKIDQCLCNIDAKLERLSNRLPLWATLLISILMGVCGWLASKAFGG